MEKKGNIAGHRGWERRQREGMGTEQHGIVVGMLVTARDWLLCTELVAFKHRDKAGTVIHMVKHLLATQTSHKSTSSNPI